MTPLYLYIWDDLYAFLSNVMDNFDFEASQVAKVYSDILIPNNKLLKEKVFSFTNFKLGRISKKMFLKDC